MLDHAIRGEERSGMDLVPELRRISPAAPIAILSNYDQFQLEEKEEGERRLSYWLKIDTPPPVLVRRAQLLLSR